MTWRIFLVVLALQLGLAPAARAGIFWWRKKDKPAPTQPSQPLPPVQVTQRVAELIHVLRSDSNDGKRVAAAEQLQQHDAVAYPEMVSALRNALLRDPKSEVRAAAALTLGRSRAMTQEIGRDLEQAATSDGSRNVRSQARAALQQYQRNGYRKIDGPALAPVPGTVTTAEPPLADPPPPAPIAPAPGVARPMPSGPPSPPLVPATPPKLETPPGPNEGPALTPP